MKTHSLLARQVSTRLRPVMCAALTFAAGAAVAQTARDGDRVDRDDARVARTPAGERVKLKNPDRKFVEKVARMSLEEAQISRVAAERTSNPRVRDFAEELAADHAAMSAELSSIAADKGVLLPAKDVVGDKWLKRDGKTFDLDYLKRMLSDHEGIVELFQEQARDGHDSGLVEFARKHLPGLQRHLQAASDLHKLMK